MPDKTYAPDLRSNGARHQNTPTRGSSVSVPDTAGIQNTVAPGRALGLPREVLALQRTVGNRTVTSMLRSRADTHVPGVLAEQKAITAHLLTPQSPYQSTLQRNPTPPSGGEANFGLPAVDSNSVPSTWRQVQLPLSGGQDVYVYRGFAEKAETYSATVVRKDEIGGILTRRLDTANDAIFNKYGSEPVLSGPDRAGVVRIRIPAAVWDALVRTNSISERSYPGFSRRLDSTEIRVNSGEAGQLINGQPRDVLPPDPKWDFRTSGAGGPKSGSASPEDVTPPNGTRVPSQATTQGSGTPGDQAPEGRSPGTSTELPVKTQYNVLSTQEIPGNRVVSDVEVILGDGLEVMNGRIVGEGGQPVPGRFILRITTDANGALVAAEATSTEAAALAETLARQALQSAPKVGVAGVGGGGVAGAARAVSPWVKGVSWAGLALFVLVTGYRYHTATPENKPRVLARAGGGLAAGVLGSYAVCNLVLGIETLGWSLLICGALVGVPAGVAGEAAADVAYDEATIDDDEIRAWVTVHGLADIERLPVTEKLRMILSVMRGWVSDDDIAAIQRILASVSSAAEMAALRRAIEPHLSDLSSIGQRTQVRVALARQI